MKGKRTVSKKNSKNLLIGLLVIVIIVAVVLAVVLGKNKKNNNNNNKAVNNNINTVKNNNNNIKTVKDGLTITDIATKMYNFYMKTAEKNNGEITIKNLHGNIKYMLLDDYSIILEEVISNTKGDVISNTKGLDEESIKILNNIYNICLNSNTREEEYKCEKTLFRNIQ